MEHLLHCLYAVDAPESLLFLGDIAGKRFRLWVSMLPLNGLSVCYIRGLCSNGRRYRHNFSCARQLRGSRVSLRSHQNLAYIGVPIPPQILS